MSMAELSAVLLAHAQRYPAMEPTDAVKLIYQNEFGGGHMIHDAERCLAYLRREYGATPRDPSHPLAEEIGNGIVRVHLSALPAQRLEELGQAFLRSAELQQGSLSCFLAKLDLLRQLCCDGHFRFGLDQLDHYLADYADAGYPAVSHSEAYRMAYVPAYRIVLISEFDP